MQPITRTLVRFLAQLMVFIPAMAIAFGVAHGAGKLFATSHILGYAAGVILTIVALILAAGACHCFDTPTYSKKQ